MDTPIHGFVKGNSIEFPVDLGIADGQEVEVHVRVIGTKPNWGEGIRRTAGALADDDQWDGIMEEIDAARNEPGSRSEG